MREAMLVRSRTRHRVEVIKRSAGSALVRFACGPQRDRCARCHPSQLAPLPADRGAPLPRVAAGAPGDRRWLYHFTAAENLPSIERLGLLSLGCLERLGVTATHCSNDDSRRLDARLGLRDHVHLCRNPTHRMADAVVYRGRVSRVVWLRVDARALAGRAVLYTDHNATARRARRDRDPETLWSSAERALSS